MSNSRGLIPAYCQHLKRGSEPSLGHWQVLSAATIGPYKCFSSNDGPIRALWQQQWAHMSASATSWEDLWTHSLPSVIFLSATMGSCKDTRSISEKTAGPFRIISRTFGSNDGPIPGYQQHLTGEAVGVMTPPMVGSTWPRVHSTLELDCLPVLSQGTALFHLVVD